MQQSRESLGGSHPISALLEKKNHKPLNPRAVSSFFSLPPTQKDIFVVGVFVSLALMGFCFGYDHGLKLTKRYCHWKFLKKDKNSRLELTKLRYFIDPLDLSNLGLWAARRP